MSTRQIHGQRAVQTIIEPNARAFVLRELVHVSIDEQVGVEEDHRKASLSATASGLVTLSRSPIRHRPRDTTSVRRRGLSGAGSVIRFRPRRKASLTASFRVAPRASRTR